MNVKNLNHPIVVGKFSCKIAGITHDTGNYSDSRETWKELKVELPDGTLLEKIRHQTNHFPVSEGQEIMINWVVPKNRSIDAWYYSTS